MCQFTSALYGGCINRKWLSWDCENYQKIGSIWPHNRLWWGKGSERPEAHTLQKLTQASPPPHTHTHTPTHSPRGKILTLYHYKGLGVSLQSRCWKYQLHILIFLKTSLLQYLQQFIYIPLSWQQTTRVLKSHPVSNRITGWHGRIRIF